MVRNIIPRPEYPRPDWQRENWLNLNGNWSFTFDVENKGIDEKWYEKENLHFADVIVVPFSWASPLSGIGKNTKGTAWYSRNVNWRPDRENHRIFLKFGAVDYECQVWINEKYVGTHSGGYGSFEFDVTSFWELDSGNIITIRVQDEDNNYQARGKQGYGEIRGIWQSVWLEARPQNFLQWARFTTHLDGEIEVEGIIRAQAQGEAVLNFSFENNRVSSSSAITLKNGENSFHTCFKVPCPHLWSPDNPYLYYGYIELEVNSKRDRVFTYFGIREISAERFEDREYPWITLNGEPVFLNGTLDQSFNPQGYFTYPSDEEMRDEIWRLKRLGLNFVRIHIKPEEPRKLYWADQLGVLVMEDMPCFWGEPREEARKYYESEAQEILLRDINHPSIISWVMFNETWGLFTTTEKDKRAYLPETQQWVKGIYNWAKQLDPSRLVEDNSPCNYDHVESDLNTWHFYINGYEKLKNHVQQVVEQSYLGSTFNYIGGNKQNAVPLMNSECGAVWGIEGSAGDSDIAWHYHYMINEFRKHDKLCGFIFTEFHDVVNEFNGYYRIDNSDKDFGYEGFDGEMTLKDLHSADFLVIDAPPCTTVEAGEEVSLPILASSYSPKYHGQKLKLVWKLWYDNLGMKKTVVSGEEIVEWDGYGVRPLTNISVSMPQYDSVAVLNVALVDSEGSTIARNFTTFDVQSKIAEGSYDVEGKWISIPPANYSSEQWQYTWKALNDNKVNGGPQGYFQYEIPVDGLQDIEDISSMEIIFEAGSKTILGKDKEMITVKPHDISYMHGAKADPGMNINSYIMTDDKKQQTQVEVLIDGEVIDRLWLADDPADSRGVLSWHYQEGDRKLEEAGSYGYLQKVKVPSRLVANLMRKGTFTLQFRVPEDLPAGQGGLALYGRKAGRYPVDIVVRGW